MAFATALDIAQFACVRLGQTRITSMTQEIKQAREIAFVYDKLRQAELERNLWAFATKSVVLRKIGIDTVLWTPAAWAASVAQLPGMVLSYTSTDSIYSGQTFYWQLSAAETTSVAPDANTLWHRYCGPTAIDLYDMGTAGDGTTNSTYQAGEVVLVPSTWAAGTTYAANAVVLSQSIIYVSLAGSNLANLPTDTAWWTPWTSRGRTDQTYGWTADESPVPLTYPGTVTVYLSLYGNNKDFPTPSSVTWRSLGGTVAGLRIGHPYRGNAFYLPSGYLKRAPSDPKGNTAPYLGAAYGVPPDDWTPEGNLIVTSEAGPLTLRFVADVIDVPDMNPLFCVGLAERIAVDTCESITSSDAKVAMAERAYRRAIFDARVSNAIEIGPLSPVENRYVVVRR